ncbi:MAG TPA: alpha/beta fold hydrolase [Candidatus Binataceae bacterium]|nr:alpha/beta fold hydrolase [Candidatus Binataceae bacterium]
MASADEEPPSIAPVVDKSDFFFPGEGVSALLIHGLSGTPYEMRWLGEQLAARGIRVRGVKLTGHAGNPEELGLSNYDNWYESVVLGFEELRQHGDPCVIVGLSLGAVLGARLAIDQRESIAGIAMLAPAFFLPWRATLGIRIVQRLGSLIHHLYLYNDVGSDIHDAAARRIHPTMRLFPLSGPLNLLELSRTVRPRLDRITQPALTIYSRQDHTCPIGRNMSFVSKHLGSAERRDVVLNDSYHVITVDSEKHVVAAEVAAFVGKFRVPNTHRAAG